MLRCDVEVIPNLTQFHVRPLAVGASAPASVFNSGDSCASAWRYRSVKKAIGVETGRRHGCVLQ
jgi:hypothetical protein